MPAGAPPATKPGPVSHPGTTKRKPQPGIYLVGLLVLGLILSGAASWAGTKATEDTHPDCESSPLNATQEQCTPVVHLAKSIGTMLFLVLLWGSPLWLVLVIADLRTLGGRA